MILFLGAIWLFVIPGVVIGVCATFVWMESRAFAREVKKMDECLDRMLAGVESTDSESMLD